MSCIVSRGRLCEIIPLNWNVGTEDKTDDVMGGAFKSNVKLESELRIGKLERKKPL